MSDVTLSVKNGKRKSCKRKEAAMDAEILKAKLSLRY